MWRHENNFLDVAKLHFVFATLPYIPLEERRRIAELSLQGWSQRAICRLMNRSRAAVSRIIRTYHDSGGTLADGERSGRPSATDNLIRSSWPV